jgi:sRNA-binding protein
MESRVVEGLIDHERQIDERHRGDEKGTSGLRGEPGGDIDEDRILDGDDVVAEDRRRVTGQEAVPQEKRRDGDEVANEQRAMAQEKYHDAHGNGQPKPVERSNGATTAQNPLGELDAIGLDVAEVVPETKLEDEAEKKQKDREPRPLTGGEQARYGEKDDNGQEDPPGESLPPVARDRPLSP